MKSNITLEKFSRRILVTEVTRMRRLNFSNQAEKNIKIL